MRTTPKKLSQNFIDQVNAIFVECHENHESPLSVKNVTKFFRLFCYEFIPVNTHASLVCIGPALPEWLTNTIRTLLKTSNYRGRGVAIVHGSDYMEELFEGDK